MEFKQAFATGADAAYNSRTLEYSKVLGDRLPGKLAALYYCN